ncbi:MAG: hypothetical protein COB65_10520 [Thalassobium sp.]|uniref:hypothetical protein n=1 Tax=Octadecabacter sp. SW4 TaxID=2602067 RepID=UPI000C0EAC11|nr:hypothetical protein [Octadecabacter sp. SW4]PHQ81095.1 MAG: hypothetical protein COB65_10520 [Thalassobium sp.]QEE34909.1 hypothetical protein FTO60_03765 [Octadecabacter sp. SW4]
MDPDTLHKLVEEIRTLMRDRLRVRGRDLGRQVHKAGRLLPKRQRRDGAFLAQAAVLAQNPKLARMVDEDRVRRAHDDMVAFLKTVDPKDRAKGRLLGFLGVIAFNLLLIFAVGVWYLWARGLV